MLEFLIGGAIGSAITHGVVRQMSRVEQQNMERRYGEARACYEQEQYGKAISILEELIQKYPPIPQFFTLLWQTYAVIATREENKENAVKAVDKALGCYDVVLWLAKNGAFVPQGVLDELEKNSATLRTVKDVALGKVQLADDRASEYADKAKLAAEAGNFKDALKQISKAIELETYEPMIASHHWYRGMIQAALGKNANAISDLKIALKYEGLPDDARRSIRGLIRKLQKEAADGTRTKTRPTRKKRG